MTTKKPAPALSTAVTTHAQRTSLVRKFAAKFGLDDDKLMATLKATAFRQPKAKDGKDAAEVTNEQMAALLVVADQYNLNPFTKEIYAFPDKGGGIVPIVSVDGWIRIINERPELRSIEFEYPPEEVEREHYWVQCTIVRSDRTAPLTIREYFAECYRPTDPWNNSGRRMTRHRALIQCARVAFGFAGIYDPDEAQRIAEAMAIDGTAHDVTHKSGTEAPRAIAAPAPEGGRGQPAPSALKITPPLVEVLQKRLEQYSVAEARLLTHFGIAELADLPFDQADAAYDWIATADAT